MRYDLTDLGVARPGQPARGFIDPPGRPGKAGCGRPCRHEWFDAETGSQQHCSRPQAHSTMQRTSPLRRHVFDALAVARHSHGYKSPSDAEADEARSSGLNAEFGFAAVSSSDSSRSRRATNPQALVDFWIPLVQAGYPLM